jgi:hypothetical protein
MNIDFLADYTIPVIVGLCLIFGFIIKKWVKDVDNKWIPTLCCALGIALAIVSDWHSISLTTILAGGVSGLASTGLHQAFTQLIAGQTHKE